MKGSDSTATSAIEPKKTKYHSSVYPFYSYNGEQLLLKKRNLTPIKAASSVDQALTLLCTVGVLTVCQLMQRRTFTPEHWRLHKQLRCHFLHGVHGSRHDKLHICINSCVQNFVLVLNIGMVRGFLSLKMLYFSTEIRRCRWNVPLREPFCPTQF